MIHIKEAIIVEGKFDKSKLKPLTDAVIIETNGFALYKDRSLIKTIRQLAKERGIIVFTDSDSAGLRIRNYIKQCVGKEGVVKQAYIPTTEGKEKRKEKASREGLLGVEGIDTETLKKILIKASSGEDESKTLQITKQMFFEDGLTGKADSRLKREKVCMELGLPKRMSTNALLEVMNKIYGYEEYIRTVSAVSFDR